MGSGTITNFGSIYKIFLGAGSVTNGSVGSTSAHILDQIKVRDGTGTVVNFGRIGGFVLLDAGGYITNGSARSTGASIGGNVGLLN
jgi:hypothetical protein